MSDKLRDGQIELFNDFEEKEQKSEKELLKIYSNNLIDYKKYMANLFENYEENGKLTYDEIIKYRRIDKMDEALKGLTVALYSESAKAISSSLKDTYTNGSNGMSEILSGSLGRKSLISIIKDEEMRRALTNEISGLKWTSRMGIHREHAANKIRETIVRGLHEGETYSQMAKRLEEALGKDVLNPLRIVRAESSRVFSQARKDRLDKIKGTDMTKEWITSADESVRSNHAAMRGIKIPYNDDFILPNGNIGFAPCMIGAAEDDINCRCFWVVDFADADKTKSDLLIHDELSGETKNTNSDNMQKEFDINKVLEEMRSNASNVQEKDVRLYYEYQLSKPKTFVIDKKSASALHYNPNDGKIYINPSHVDFFEYDIPKALAHEIGHKIDIEVVESFKDTKYLAAIRTAAEQFMNNSEQYISLSTDNEIYNNMLTGDIISALSKGIISVRSGHYPSYWDKSGITETELFANIFAAEVLGDKTTLKFLENEMSNLLEAFRKTFGS